MSEVLKLFSLAVPIAGSSAVVGTRSVAERPVSVSCARVVAHVFRARDGYRLVTEQ